MRTYSVVSLSELLTLEKEGMKRRRLESASNNLMIAETSQIQVQQVPKKNKLKKFNKRWHKKKKEMSMF